MSEPERADDVVQTLSELGNTAVPVEDPQRAAYRRERIVRLVGATITAEKRRSRRVAARPWVAAAAAAVFALGAAGAWRSFHGSPPKPVAVAERASAGEARLVAGDVSVRRAGRTTNLVVGDVFVGGEVVSTAAYSVAEIGIASGRAELGASSELEIVSPTTNERRLRLRTGSVDVDLPHKLEAGKHLVVETPDAEVLVVGTAFTVNYGSQHGVASTEVHVRRGTVWIMQGGSQRAVLRAGDEWSSATAPTAAADAPAPVRSRAARVSASPAARPAAPTHAADSGTLAEENRLFQAGLTARNAGDSAGAADAFSGLLSRYPHSVLREQALAEQFRALDRAGRSSAATVAARRYLASYPNGFARADAERVTSGPLGAN
ncbi:MAG TPA: FecR domain-containing protein [Polyangiaceae bacterium]|nr:FecR domain-containing protein [Polyangiaceae bacterium]